MKNLRIVAFVVIVLSMAALACSLGSVSKAPEVVETAKAVATEVGAGASTPTPAAKGAPTSAPSSSGGENPLSLQSRQAGLDKLKSYKMRWQAQWSSTISGTTESAGWDWVEEYSSEPAALHWVWNITDSKDQSKGMNMEAWQVGNNTYMLTKDAAGKGECISFSSDDKSNQLTKGLFNPNMLGSVNDAKYAGTETVNGIKARHYKYDEKSVALFAAGKVSGDIWVAIDGGYVVKETVSWSGVGGLFGTGSKAKGDGKWNWELSDVNQAITITPPENCGGAAADIPVMKDAVEKASFGDTISYKSPSKLADVVEFYKEQMPSAGWKLEGEPEVADEYASLEFTKGGQTAKVVLSTDQDKTQVLITVEK